MLVRGEAALMIQSANGCLASLLPAALLRKVSKEEGVAGRSREGERSIKAKQVIFSWWMLTVTVRVLSLRLP